MKMFFTSMATKDIFSDDVESTKLSHFYKYRTHVLMQ